jgi:hypothetical protein
VLPDDGRKSRALAEQRRTLAQQLATYADADGTRIAPSMSRLSKELGWPERTINRRLSELAKIGPGLLSKHGLTKEQGNAVRWLDISKLKMPDAETPDSTVEQERQIHAAGTPDTKAETPDSGAGTPPIGGVQPSVLTDTRPTHIPPNPWGWPEEYFVWIA